MKPEEKKSFIRKIPGFRSGKPWKMVLATIFYVFIILIVLALIVPSGKDGAQQKSLTVEEIKAQAINVTYDELFRHNEDYIGKIVYKQVKVIQVGDSNLLVEIPSTFSTDTMYVEGYKGERLREDDLINLWGRVEGLYTYTTVSGIENTAIKIKYLHSEFIQNCPLC
jgi:hypothetical protein